MQGVGNAEDLEELGQAGAQVLHRVIAPRLTEALGRPIGGERFRRAGGVEGRWRLARAEQKAFLWL